MRLRTLNEAVDPVMDVYRQYSDRLDAGEGTAGARSVVDGIVDDFVETLTSVMDNHRDHEGNRLRVKVGNRDRERFTVTCTVTDENRDKTIYTMKLGNVAELRSFNLNELGDFIDLMKARRPIPTVLTSLGFKER